MMTLPNPLQESLDFKIQQFEEERTISCNKLLST
ncbi:hypothetical protein NO758_03952 [Planktothrix agardhii]|uniref:Uncharacterized protein n=1 Tax=Planktothrix rubescens CCAP 1459/22 TaxID=329571 RepID=A0A6J7ZQI8_PLARU|nr:conserved hypothetical protein [Planktothrix rubescens NIVA-CYA 18]CAD5967192.1 hypothetical protein PCC7821_03541 [Planktothrix rubescens NIVA-CYA 18]CAD5973796.1 hypothetical protein NO758_03952 [Planktothrix agardhii]CAH2574045.1 hypothetical protein PRNO82_03464 [Planktothrix rubescens]